jgi:hypothetical protein
MKMYERGNYEDTPFFFSSQVTPESRDLQHVWCIKKDGQQAAGLGSEC